MSGKPRHKGTMFPGPWNPYTNIQRSDLHPCVVAMDCPRIAWTQIGFTSVAPDPRRVP